MAVIQWYPGHMEKARREMNEKLKAVDLIIELRDARIPSASRNPLIQEMAPDKPRIIILSKCDEADPAETKNWIRFLNTECRLCMAVDLMNDPKIGKKIAAAAVSVMKPERERMEKKGIHPRAVRAMAAGIPNVGKSTMINRLKGKNTLRAEDHPGVTRSLTWVHADPQLDILDTPGVLWPKFEDDRTGSLLAAMGSINDEIIDKKMIAMDTIHIIQDLYPGILESFYESGTVNPNGMLKAIAAKYHILKQGEPDTKQAASSFLNDLRKGRIGRFTLERTNEENLSE